MDSAQWVIGSNPIRNIGGVRKGIRPPPNCFCAVCLNTRSEKSPLKGFSQGMETSNGREFVHINLSQLIYQSLTSEGYTRDIQVWSIQCMVCLMIWPFYCFTLLCVFQSTWSINRISYCYISPYKFRSPQFCITITIIVSVCIGDLLITTAMPAKQDLLRWWITATISAPKIMRLNSTWVCE